MVPLWSMRKIRGLAPSRNRPRNLTRWRLSARRSGAGSRPPSRGRRPPRSGGWEAISSGAHTLICAPTGSGKTLASFLWGIDRLSRASDQAPGVRLVYVSPLKALSYDIERNLRAPLKGIGADISVGLRTGDTPQSERRAMKKTPPEILITTPESLYLMLSSSVREIFATTEAVIVDEIHAVAQIEAGVASGADAGAARSSGQGVGGGLCRATAGRLVEPSPDAQQAGARAPASVRASSGSGSPRRSGRWSGLRSSSSGPRGSARSWMPGSPRSSICRSSSRSTTWPSRAPPTSPTPRACRRRASRSPTSARSGPRSTPSCSSWSRNTTRRSSSSTPAAPPSAWPNASTSSPTAKAKHELPATEHGGHSGEDSAEQQRGGSGESSPEHPTSRSPALITGPSPTRSGCSSRRC